MVSALRMAQAQALQVRRRGCLDTCLLELRAIDEPSLLPYLSRAAELPVLADGLLGTQRPLPEVLTVFPLSLAERFSAVPAQLLSDGVLQVLVTVDAEASELETLSHILAYRIEPWVVCEFRYHEALSLCFGQPLSPRFVELLAQSQRVRQRRAIPVPLWKGHLPRFGSLDAARTLLALRPPASLPPPIVEPTVEPVVEASVEPVVEPTVEPVVEPAVKPSVEPVVEPSVEPVVEPSVEPVVEASEEPAVEPAVEPSVEPAVEPSVEPSVEPVVGDPDVVTVKEHRRRQYYGPGRSLVRWITVKSYTHRRAAPHVKSS